MPSRRFESVKATIKARSAWIFCIFGFIAGAVATPFIASSVVALVGFGSKGVEKGFLSCLPIQKLHVLIISLDSWAARTQAAIGDVEADSPFALAQSIGMGGGVPLYGIIAGGLILAILSLPVYFIIRYILQVIARLVQAMKRKCLAR